MMCKYNLMDDTVISTDIATYCSNAYFFKSTQHSYCFTEHYNTCFDLTLQVIVRSLYNVFMSQFWMIDKVRMRFEVLKNAKVISGVEPEQTGHLEDPSFEGRLLLNVRYRSCVKMWAEFVRAGELHDLFCSRYTFG